MARTASVPTDSELALLQALDALATSGASQAIQKTGAASFDNVDVISVSFADEETPSGDVDGSNTTFTLANSPSPVASLILTVNGQVLTSGGEDFTLSGATITAVTAPPTGSIIRAWYRY